MGVQVERPGASHQSAPIAGATAKELADPGWAWAAYEPNARRPWNLALAAHLYQRAAFGAGWESLQQALSDGPQRTVDKLLEPQADVAAFNHTYDEYENAAGASVDGLRAWWLRRMIETPQPLLEKMTLFWHSHFATNGGAVHPRLMQAHIQLLRRHALGSFDPLLRGISHDPALLLWLGADVNRKAAPDEGFVRPLMETFTLGAGNFTDEDVRGAARAFTGWFVLRNRLRYIAHEHDEKTKRILGREGNFTDEDVVEIVLEQAGTARTVVRKLYRWLISETQEPDEALIAPLAELFAEDYRISPVVETMLRSNLFFSAQAYRQRVKCPVEYAVGIVSALEGMVSTTRLAQDLADLGQDLCRPPTIKGWRGGRYWIDTAAIVRRGNLSRALLQGGEPYGDKLNPRAVAQRYGYAAPESAARFLFDVFLQGDLEPDARERLLADLRTAVTGDSSKPEAALRRLAHAIVTLPEYHLA